MLRKLVFFSAFSCLMIAADAQQLRTPAPSTSQTIKQELGIGAVELSYSRPSARNRKVFGDLVPYGAIWRTGANNATTLTFTEEMMINGTKIPAGKYGLLSIPTPREWELIITKQTDVTSPAAYKKENDLVRVKVPVQATASPVETFTIQFANIKPASADLQISWENALVSLPITMDVDSRVMAQINNMMSRDSRPYFQAAMYYMETGRDMNQAIQWFDKAAEQNPDAFWIHHQRAAALAKAGRKEDARKAANTSIELARKAQNMDYVRLNENLLNTLK